MGSNSIIIIRFSGLGDVAIAAPIVDLLAKTHKITVMTTEASKDVFSSVDNIDVITGDHLRNQRDMIAFANHYKNNFDVVADLHGSFRSKMITSALDLPFARYNSVTEFAQLDRYIDVFKRLGIIINPFDLKPLSKSNTNILDVITNGSGEKVIGFAPKSIVPAKSLDIKDAIAKVKALQTKGKVLLFGYKKEYDLAKIASATGAINTAGRLPLKEELEIISRLDLMVSVDSSNGHMAANYGVPTLTIWKSTTPDNGYTPFMQPKENSFLDADDNQQIINRICSFL